MHQSVIEAWHAFSTPLEGRVHGMYCDVLGLVTCAVGNLIDPISQAELLPWALADGSKADLAQVRADWHKLKDGAAYYSKRHYKFALDATKCRLTDEAIDTLVSRKRAEFELFLKSHYFPKWESFPADAQLGIMSMAWACGPGFPIKFGNFRNAVLAENWEAAVGTCKIREEGNPGVVPRNAKNRFCFHNAALVKAHGLPTEMLCWPNVAPVGFPGEPSVLSVAAHAAADEAQVKLAAWKALEMSPVVGGSGAALLEHDAHDTDPAPAPDADEPESA